MTFKNSNGLRLHGRTHRKEEGKEKKDQADDKEAEESSQNEEGSSSIYEEKEKSPVKTKTPPTKKKKDAIVTPRKKRSPSRSASPKTSKTPETPKTSNKSSKKKVKVDEKIPFKVGAVLEGENNDLELLLYVNTIHDVEYVGPSKEDPDMHRCRMPAFHGRPIFEWNTHELHEKRPQEDEKKKDFEVGEQVHVLLKNRVGINDKGKRISDLDGHFAKTGVWVKAKVTEIDKGSGVIKVEHVSWSIPHKNKKRTHSIVGKDEIRKDWTK